MRKEALTLPNFTVQPQGSEHPVTDTELWIILKSQGKENSTTGAFLRVTQVQGLHVTTLGTSLVPPTEDALTGTFVEAMCPQAGPLLKEVPYPKGLKGVFNLNNLLDVVGDGGNDLVNEMHHAVGRMVVSFQQPGTVNCYNLPEKK